MRSRREVRLSASVFAVAPADDRGVRRFDDARCQPAQLAGTRTRSHALRCTRIAARHRVDCAAADRLRAERLRRSPRTCSSPARQPRLHDGGTSLRTRGQRSAAARMRDAHERLGRRPRMSPRRDRRQDLSQSTLLRLRVPRLVLPAQPRCPWRRFGLGSSTAQLSLIDIICPGKRRGIDRFRVCELLREVRPDARDTSRVIAILAAPRAAGRPGSSGASANAAAASTQRCTCDSSACRLPTSSDLIARTHPRITQPQSSPRSART